MYITYIMQLYIAFYQKYKFLVNLIFQQVRVSYNHREKICSVRKFSNRNFLSLNYIA